MEDQGIIGTEVFHEWLMKECAYLSLLSKKPMQETLEMEHYQKLVDLCAAKYMLLT